MIGSFLSGLGPFASSPGGGAFSFACLLCCVEVVYTHYMLNSSGKMRNMGQPRKMLQLPLDTYQLLVSWRNELEAEREFKESLTLGQAIREAIRRARES